MEGILEHCDGGLARRMVPGYGPAMATFHSSFGWALHLSSHPHPLVGVMVSLAAEEGADPSVEWSQLWHCSVDSREHAGVEACSQASAGWATDKTD